MWSPRWRLAEQTSLEIWCQQTLSYVIEGLHTHIQVIKYQDWTSFHKIGHTMFIKFAVLFRSGDRHLQYAYKTNRDCVTVLENSSLRCLN
jgi:hypothetical protein